MRVDRVGPPPTRKILVKGINFSVHGFFASESEAPYQVLKTALFKNLLLYI